MPCLVNEIKLLLKSNGQMPIPSRDHRPVSSPEMDTKRRIRTPPVPVFLLLLLLLVVSIAEGKRRVSVPDDLDDVVDDEEDEAWRQWGKKKTSPDDRFDHPPDFATMDMAAIQAEMMRRHTGPSVGFVKLRPGVRRTRDEVGVIAMRWSKVLRTGSIEARFMAVDLNTLMFNMEKGQDIEELKEFVLSQPEAYEMKIGEQLFRRPGDPPLEEVLEMLHRKNNGDDDVHDPTKEQHHSDEL